MLKTRVLILAKTRETGDRWAEMVRPVTESIGFPTNIPFDYHPEVVITDTDTTPGGDYGIIRLGGVGPAEVTLPEDVTERELQTACRLLGEIVRLRRRERGTIELGRHWRNEALTDPLTNLPNRRAWDEELQQRLEEMVRFGKAGSPPLPWLCLAMLDLDFFKRINDEYGHRVGDAVLIATGRGLCESLRPDDFVARLGGDEFCLLLFLPDASNAPSVIERVRTALPLRFEKENVPSVTASVGYVLVDLREAIEAASVYFSQVDEALHRAKRSGRDRSATS